MYSAPQTPSKEKWAAAEERPYFFKKILLFCIILILFKSTTEHIAHELALEELIFADFETE